MFGPQPFAISRDSLTLCSERLPPEFGEVRLVNIDVVGLGYRHAIEAVRPELAIHPITGEVVRVGPSKGPHLTRPLMAFGSGVAAAIIGCSVSGPGSAWEDRRVSANEVDRHRLHVDAVECRTIDVQIAMSFLAIPSVVSNRPDVRSRFVIPRNP